MSKKKFKAGLESLFGDVGDDQLPGIRPLLVEEESNKISARHQRRPKRRSSKNFTSDLEGLFHGVLGKEYKEHKDVKEESQLPKGRDTTAKKRNDRPIIGIDALIRRTSVEKIKLPSLNSPLKRRVTLTLEKQKLEQLKLIAKSKKSYLKDIVGEIISNYLEKRTST